MGSQNQREVAVKIHDEETQTQMIESLTSSFDQKLAKRSGNPSLSFAASIYRVAQKLRASKEACYTPRLVSIGPLHHGIAQFQAMEATKLEFLHTFLNRFGISPHTLVKFAATEESFVRRCYEGTVNLSTKVLTELILLDGVFVVELFLEKYFVELRNSKEMIFEDKLKHNDLLHDMMLLENQLPISIMISLLSFVDFSFLNGGVELTIYHLAHKFFGDVGATRMIPLTARSNQARHFVEFLLFLHATRKGPERSSSYEAKVKQQSSLVRKFLVCCDERGKVRKQLSQARKFLPSCCGMGKGASLARKFLSCCCCIGKARKLSAAGKFEYTRSATELREAGVRFRSGEGDCLLVVDFSGDMLTIPKLKVNALTETFFRNLIAFEHLGYTKTMTSYVILMDGFINTSSDVDLLEEKGIIVNELGESQDVADLFNNLHKEVVTEGNDFYFTEVCRKLNAYSKNCIHRFRASWFRWTVMLGRDYFSTPWSCLSVCAAILLLFLTIIQTVLSILQFLHVGPKGS